MKIFLTVVITLASLSLLLFLFIFSGIFNPDALTPHSHFTKWAITTTKNISINKRIKNINVPYLDDTTMIQTGFVHYNEMCVTCHSAPGMGESEIAKGLYPEPPELYRYAGKMDPKETFWVIKNGIKMTGMPAFALTHDDQKIWAITAFIKNKLGNMTPEEYKSWQKKFKNEKMDSGE